MGQSRYDSAQICVSRHVITTQLDISPELSQEFCEACGKPTITACKHCDTAIRGEYYPYSDAIFKGGRVYRSPPSYCHKCGAAYPWTQARLQAARELADELDELSPDEIDVLKGSLDDLVADTPRTALAATRFKKLVAKVGPVVADGFKQILIDVVSESAKKMIWG